MSIDIPGLPQEKYRGQRIGLLANVPRWAKRVLFIGTDKGRPGYLVRKHMGGEVYGIERNKEAAEVATELLNSVIQGRPETAELPFGTEFFDAIVILDPPDSVSLTTWMSLMRSYLTPEGRMLVLSLNDSYYRELPGPALSEHVLMDSGTAVGLKEWAMLRAADPEFSADLLPSSALIEYLGVFTREDYDPLVHANKLREAGRPDYAFSVLREARPPADEKDVLAMQCVMLDCLCAWGRQGELEAPDRLYYQAIELFYEIVKKSPTQAEAYLNIADIWVHMGSQEMGARQLRSLQHLTRNETAATKLKKLSGGRVVRKNLIPPEWNEKGELPRILFVMHPRPHFGLDVLYDGLVGVLGSDRVVEYPPKPTLHGGVDPGFANYPCNFNLPNHKYSLERCIDELKAGQFDFVLYGDCERGLARQESRMLVEAATGTPLFLLDQRDEFFCAQNETMQYAGIGEHAGYFKREMLACLDYGPQAMPMPFGFPDCRVPNDIPEERLHFFFWAGHRRFSLRRLYLEQVEKALNEKFDTKYSSEEYAERLKNSRVGLNSFGAGFDTVRYWELPAHGCLLLSERLPIEIPYDFRDGETALFFDDAGELERKMNYIQNHPDLIANLAAAGREHFLKYHTGSARARQLLGWVDKVLRGY